VTVIYSNRIHLALHQKRPATTPHVSAPGTPGPQMHPTDLKRMWRRTISNLLPYTIYHLDQALRQRTPLFADFQVLLQLRQRARADDDPVTELRIQGRMVKHPAQRDRVAADPVLLRREGNFVRRVEQVFFEEPVAVQLAGCYLDVKS
jgi:hypothetical protein